MGKEFIDKMLKTKKESGMAIISEKVELKFKTKSGINAIIKPRANHNKK